MILPLAAGSSAPAVVLLSAASAAPASLVADVSAHLSSAAVLLSAVSATSFSAEAPVVSAQLCCAVLLCVSAILPSVFSADLLFHAVGVPKPLSCHAPVV